MDSTAFFKLAYGLYVVTTRKGDWDNGMICNTVVQVANKPERLAVSINKSNWTHDVVKETGVMNVCALAESASFDLFKRFGFQSGRNVEKFEGFTLARGANGLALLTKDCTATFELKVVSYTDLGTHGMFICEVVDAKTVSDAPTMTYAYYHANVKPKPAAPAAASASEKKTRRWVCKICGYVYEGDELPADFECPWCKHPASDFEEVL